MRLNRSACLLALAAFVAAPAMAQNNNVQYVPVYNTQTNGTPYYAPTGNGTYPVYNNLNNTPPLPMQQMIAGKNAPSYNYPNQIQPYNFQNNGGFFQQQSLTTPQEQQAMLYQQQLLAQQQAQQQPQPSYNPQNFNTPPAGLNRSPFGNTPDSQIPTKRKVLYKQMNDPLKTPPRLFNPDQ